MAKPDSRVEYPRLFIEEEHAEPIYVKYKDLEKDIQKLTDDFVARIEKMSAEKEKEIMEI